MTEATPVLPVAAVPRRSVWRDVLRNPVAVAALTVLLVIVAISIGAPLFTDHDPTRADLQSVLAPPFSEGHPLGGDSAGRDIFARLLYGGRLSLAGSVIAVTVAMLIGIPTGLVAGYYQRWFDQLASWIADLIMALPGLIVLLALTSVIGNDVYSIMVVFGALLAPGVFRLTRSGVITVRNELYIDASKVSGLSDRRILTRHVFRVVRAPLVIQAAMMLGIGIVLQAGLQFLGIGSANDVSWGAMLNDAFNNIYVAAHMLIWPGGIIALTVASFALFGNALRDTVQGSTSSRSARKANGPEVLPPQSTLSASARDATAGGRAPVPLLTVTALRIGYPQADGSVKVVVDDVNLQVAKGEVLGLVGESGSGKTQTAFSILGLLPRGGRVIGGSITFGGERIDDDAGRVGALRGKRIGYIPQEPMSNLDPSFTVGAQLVEPMRRHLGLSRSSAAERAKQLLDRVGIADPSRTFAAYPHQISGGMAQRVLIAGAVSCDPELIIADEPTTALDVTVQAEVLDVLRELQAERNMGLLIVTHNFGVVADLCDRVAVMAHGRIVEQGTARTLFAEPDNEYTQMLLASTLEDAPPRKHRIPEAVR